MLYREASVSGEVVSDGDMVSKASLGDSCDPGVLRGEYGGGGEATGSVHMSMIGLQWPEICFIYHLGPLGVAHRHAGFYMFAGIESVAEAMCCSQDPIVADCMQWGGREYGEKRPPSWRPLANWDRRIEDERRRGCSRQSKLWGSAGCCQWLGSHFWHSPSWS